MNYLGITLDRGFTLRVTEKAEKRVAMLERVMPNMGGPSSAQRTVLCGVVHSIILYGAPIWHEVINKRTQRETIEKPHRRTLLRIISAFRTAPTLGLLVIAGLLPIDLLIRERKNVHENED